MLINIRKVASHNVFINIVEMYNRCDEMKANGFRDIEVVLLEDGSGFIFAKYDSK